MQNSKPEVFTALQRAHPRVYFVSPDDEAVLPAVSYMELNNVPADDADDEEYSTLEEYVVDVWSEVGSEEVSPIVSAVNDEMVAIGFHRTHCTDVPKSDADGAYHKNIIFERVI